MNRPVALVDESRAPARALWAVGTARGQRSRVAHRLPHSRASLAHNPTEPTTGDARGTTGQFMCYKTGQFYLLPTRWVVATCRWGPNAGACDPECPSRNQANRLQAVSRHSGRGAGCRALGAGAMAAPGRRDRGRSQRACQPRPGPPHHGVRYGQDIHVLSRSRRCSRRRRRSASRSALVGPSSRRPSSRSAWRTRLRMFRSEHSSSRASSRTARPVRTSATLGWRSSGGYGKWVRGIVDSPSRKPKSSVSTKAGQLHESHLPDLL